ncbi:MAG: hypothetical protein P4L73_12170 [Caulobacteraceae bacterium]|nr:hypothetical protein [Caulobacteraceae bacterium]
MSYQDFSPAMSVAGPGRSPAFAEPDWRGAVDEGADEVALRPLCRIGRQIDRLSAWIAAGAGYGWLGAYQARRSAFELQSIRAHIAHETAYNGGRLPDGDRRAIQSRLDRLERRLEASRADVGVD